ncbi:M20/M25/M40 family metallo-hydrolase [Kitasatospora aureofaciens]|uniref:M20/M25/M40 family metallo-hydrolase n=1 Tax=Kitasatospora aureofaciens TaxID=1894 RepID=UPI001C477346|nr:M20/M25/M40 family metallo-hydrolase [Kitasatospora aureofaciens]MBV6697228.1 M20/M25/M40 family metallo-hydrolase [Kitasatospora aureofaciens]
MSPQIVGSPRATTAAASKAVAAVTVPAATDGEALSGAAAQPAATATQPQAAAAQPAATAAQPAATAPQPATAALPGLPQALSTRARTLAGAVRRRCTDLARIESPSGDAPRLDALAEELADGFRATGATARREPGPAGDHLVLEWEGQDETLPHLLIVGHHDTVWPAGTLADWPVTEQNGTLTGPGVVDMKGGLAILEGAFALLADLGQRPHRSVQVVVVSDEEVGSPDGRRLVERQLRGAAAVLGLEPPHPDGRLKTARRGSTRVRLTVTGREAHAGNDAHDGVSAVDELVDQLVVVRGLAGQPGTELNAGRISGGSRANVVAGRAEAELGLRFSTAEAQRRTLDNLARLTALRPGARVRTEVLSSRPAWPERSGNPLLRHVRSLAAVLGQQLDGGPAGGAGDTNLPGSRGLPTLDGFGAVGAGAHARHEYIRIDQLAPRIALLAALLAVPLPRLRDRTEG